MVISLGHNAVPEQAEQQILDVFRSGQYSPGPKVREFEEQFAVRHKAAHAIFVNSGTDALRLGLLALKEKYGWPDGAKVAVPAVTFVATVNVILQANLTPYFVDVDRHAYLINSEILERTKDENLVAVIPVHLFGQSCSDDIYELARKRNWKVLEDSCETILNPIRGDVSCHSTYMAHHVTTGVGGLALTNGMALNLLIRSYANHGRDVNYLPGYAIPELGRNLLQSRFCYDRIGYSCRATEFEAALGLSQLGGLAENVFKRQEVARKLSKAMSRMLEFQPPFLLFNEPHTCMMYPIVITQNSRIDKVDLCLHLEKNGIETREMMPITNQSCYQKFIKDQNDYPVAKWINGKGFYIPCHPGMSDEDVGHIKKVFEGFLTKK